MCRMRHEADQTGPVAVLAPPTRRMVAVGVAAVAVAVLLSWAGPAEGAPTLPGAPGCTVFPDDNVWNRPVDTLPDTPAV